MRLRFQVHVLFSSGWRSDENTAVKLASNSTLRRMRLRSSPIQGAAGRPRHEQVNVHNMLARAMELPPPSLPLSPFPSLSPTLPLPLPLSELSLSPTLSLSLPLCALSRSFLWRPPFCLLFYQPPSDVCHARSCRATLEGHVLHPLQLRAAPWWAGRRLIL